MNERIFIIYDTKIFYNYKVKTKNYVYIIANEKYLFEITNSINKYLSLFYSKLFITLHLISNRS